MTVQQRIQMMATAGLMLAIAAAPVSTLSAQEQMAGAKADSAFIQKAASGGLLEVRLGKMAQQKAQNPAVKQFGRRMVTDHSKANQQLAAAARQVGVQPPTKLAPQHQEEVKQLSGKSGKDFDRAYMDLMVKDHIEDIREFQQEASSGSAPAIKQFASQTLPTLEQHFTLAKQVAVQVGADTTGAGVQMAEPSSNQ